MSDETKYTLIIYPPKTPPQEGDFFRVINVSDSKETPWGKCVVVELEKVIISWDYHYADER